MCHLWQASPPAPPHSGQNEIGWKVVSPSDFGTLGSSPVSPIGLTNLDEWSPTPCMQATHQRPMSRSHNFFRNMSFNCYLIFLFYFANTHVHYGTTRIFTALALTPQVDNFYHWRLSPLPPPIHSSWYYLIYYQTCSSPDYLLSL